MAVRRSNLAASLFVCFLCLSVGDKTVQAVTQLATVIQLRVHGNQSISDEQVIDWAGIVVGDRVDDDIATVVQERLTATGRFEEVDIRSRYMSLTANDEIAVIIVVRESLFVDTANPFSRLFAQIRKQMLFVPLIDYTDGYGATYGLQSSLINVFGSGSRLSIPATWGGTKRVAIEVDKELLSDGSTILQGGIAWSSRENPHFEIDTERIEVSIGTQQEISSWFRGGVEARWGDVRFAALNHSLSRYRVFVELDTRINISFPRDGTWFQASYEWLDLGDSNSVVGRPRFQAELYKGLLGQSVLMVRSEFYGSDGIVPLYDRPLLGGGRSLRGWRPGEFSGDRRVNGSVELRFPIEPGPLAIGRTVATVFYDAGASYNVGQSIEEVGFRHGVGVGVFVVAPFVDIRVDIAHNLVNDVRAHILAGLSF